MHGVEEEIMVPPNRLAMAALFAILWVGLTACAHKYTVDELVGVWRTDYTGIEYDTAIWEGSAFKSVHRKLTGIEILILRADGTYQQIYDDGKGYKYISPWSRWWIERDWILHLEGGRFFALGIEDAEAYARGVALTVLGPANERVELIREMVFFVFPASPAEGGAKLVSPYVISNDPDTSPNVTFYRVSTPVATPTMHR